MRLKIYDVAYYTKEYGVIEEVSTMCQELSDYVEDKSYSEIVNYIRFGPVAAPNEILEKGLWKDYKKIWLSSKDAAVVVHIDFDTYVNATTEGKKKLIIENLLMAVKSISKKAKIDYTLFEKDIIDFCKESNLEYGMT